MRTILGKAFLGLLFVLAFLPTGTLYHIPLKLPLVGVFASLTLLHLATTRIAAGDIRFTSAVFIVILIWSLIGLLTSAPEYVGAEGQQILTTIFIAAFAKYSMREGMVSAGAICRTLIYAAAATAIIKFLILASPGGADTAQDIFGESSVTTAEITFGFFRINFGTDMLGPFAMFAMLCPSVSGVRFNSVAKSIITFLLIASGIIAFSRYIWVCYCAVFILAMMIERNWKSLILVLLACVAMGFYFSDIFTELGSKRFASDEVADSDSLRIEQYDSLIESITDFPFFGRGIGGSANVIRSDAAPYSYELQWLAFQMQFGIVGMLAILALLIMAIRDLIACRHPAKTWVALVFLSWLFSGFTNPYLISSFAGATFGLFIAIFFTMRFGSLAAKTGDLLSGS